MSIIIIKKKWRSVNMKRNKIVCLLLALLISPLFYACEQLPSVDNDLQGLVQDSLSIKSIADVMRAETWMGVQPIQTSGEDSCYWQITTYLGLTETDTGYVCRMRMRLEVQNINEQRVAIFEEEIDEPWVVERTRFEDVGIRDGEEGFRIRSLEEEQVSICLWFDRFEQCLFSESYLVPLYRKYFAESFHQILELPEDMIERHIIDLGRNVVELDDCLGRTFTHNFFIYPLDLYILIDMNTQVTHPTARVVTGGRTLARGLLHFDDAKISADDIHALDFQFYLNLLEVDSTNNEIRGYLQRNDEEPYMRICYHPSTSQVVLYWTPGEYFESISESFLPYLPDELRVHLYQESYRWCEENDIK